MKRQINFLLIKKAEIVQSFVKTDKYIIVLEKFSNLTVEKRKGFWICKKSSV